MNNWNIQAAVKYHHGTKHPHGELMNPYHYYDHAMDPPLFKIYPGLEAIPLPLDKTPVGKTALEAIAHPGKPVETGEAQQSAQARGEWPAGSRQMLDLGVLARILFFSAGITKRIHYPSYGEVLFRAAACTGALYHIELYLVNGSLPGLEAGVYHFDPSIFALRQLRRGDFRPAIAVAAGNILPHAQAFLIYTDEFFRNAVKYQAREYRHAFWDSGTILANTLAMASAHDLPAGLTLGFIDEQVNFLLDLDEKREAALALVGLGSDPGRGPEQPSEIVPLSLEVRRVSEQEVIFPAILEMHRASSLSGAQEVTTWRERAVQQQSGPSEMGEGEKIPLKPFSENEMAKDPIEKVIVRRGSARHFAREAISFAQLSTLIVQSTRGVPADYLAGSEGSLNEIYLIANQVDGLEPGSFVYHPEPCLLERLETGVFRRKAGELALGQALAADASVNIYLLSDLGQVLKRFGNRGYRAAQLDASLTAGKMYLAAYAQRLGATGLTFYDDAVTGFFSPHAAGKSVMFLIAIGIPMKR